MYDRASQHLKGLDCDAACIRVKIGEYRRPCRISVQNRLDAEFETDQGCVSAFLQAAIGSVQKPGQVR